MDICDRLETRVRMSIAPNIPTNRSGSWQCWRVGKLAKQSVPKCVYVVVWIVRECGLTILETGYHHWRRRCR